MKSLLSRAQQHRQDRELNLRARPPRSHSHTPSHNVFTETRRSVGGAPGACARFCAAVCAWHMRKAVRERRAYSYLYARSALPSSTRRGAPRGGIAVVEGGAKHVGGVGRTHFYTQSSFSNMISDKRSVCVCAVIPPQPQETLARCSCWPGQSRPAAARLGGGATRCGCRLLEFRDQ